MPTRLALIAALAVALPTLADDAKKPADPPPADAPKPAETPKPAPSSGIFNTKPQLHSAGQVEAKVGKVDGNTITLKFAGLEQAHNNGAARGRRGSGSHLQRVEKDHDYDLASDVKVRWKDLPKGPDGKPRQYTDEEYRKLREPSNTPGYKADMSDLKSGQTVRLYLSKAGKDDKPVVTTVMILADAPSGSDKAADKPKKKKDKE
jgi:hypothetical protein